jgi:D-beta-D-heptose 7-phosphate kinase/D-beta-D-heptose 1-phosphate adenosyltransferase
MARDVFDVSGAGDTVVSVLAAGLAAGWDLFESATAANAAAGIVVAKVGTATVDAAELAGALEASNVRSDRRESKCIPA